MKLVSSLFIDRSKATSCGMFSAIVERWKGAGSGNKAGNKRNVGWICALSFLILNSNSKKESVDFCCFSPQLSSSSLKLSHALEANREKRTERKDVCYFLPFFSFRGFSFIHSINFLGLSWGSFAFLPRPEMPHQFTKKRGVENRMFSTALSFSSQEKFGVRKTSPSRINRILFFSNRTDRKHDGASRDPGEERRRHW